MGEVTAAAIEAAARAALLRHGAAAWVAGKEPKLYSMKDVLGL